MGWLKRLFAKRPGGTAVGNLFRAVGDHYTAGLYSAIFPKPPEIQGLILYRSPNPANQRGFFDQLVKPSGFLGMASGVLNGSGQSSDPNATAVQNLLTTVGSDLLSGDLDVSNLDQNVIDVLDQALGDTMPDFVQDMMGIDQHGNVNNTEVANNGGWNISVGISGGGNNNSNNGGSSDPTTPASSSGQKWHEKALKWVKDNASVVGVIAGIVTIGAALFAVLKPKKKRGWRK